MTAGHDASRRIHLALAFARLAFAAVEGERVSMTSYTTDAASGSIPITAGAATRAATAFMVVDENDRGLLTTRKTIRARS